SNITAQWIFDHTTTTFKQVYGGSYEAMLKTSINGQGVTWPFDATSFGGTHGIPLFTTSIACDPPPNAPDSNSLDGQLLFGVKTPYTCSISLTPLSGSDRRTQTKSISFTTPSGQLMISRASAFSNLLTNDENNGGIVFNNTDANPITITGLTFDVSYGYLSTTTRPLIL